MPFGEGRHPFQRLRHRGRELAGPEPGRHRPDRLQTRHPVRFVGRNHVVRMRDGQPIAELLQLAGDDEPCACRHLPLARETEKDQFGETGAVGHDHSPGLAWICRGFVPDHLDGEGPDRTGAGIPDGRALPTVEIRFGQVKQNVDHPLAPGRARDQLRGRRTYAAKRGQRREKGCERVVFQG